ncbi:MAG: hypothetical protein EWV76_20205 [Microcystis novacekii Mn_MB_F_20050700_S1]|nr:MAG: hypothetical protein EWV76_20205 [Microcystis novacekii Mn_MB_F_20050700_S1]
MPRKPSPAKYFYSSLWRGTAYVTVKGAECGFQDILSLTKYLLFESWHHLLDFMLDDSVALCAVNSS